MEEKIRIEDIVLMVRTSPHFRLYKSMLTEHKISNASRLIEMICKDYCRDLKKNDLDAYKSLIEKADEYFRKKYAKTLSD